MTKAFTQNMFYNGPMSRKLSKPRPPLGARLAELRKAAGLTQMELAELVDESQQNIAYWEQIDKPPRSDAIPKLAKVLGVRAEELLTLEKATPLRRGGPVGKVRLLFEEVSRLPRQQQNKIVEFVSAVVSQYKSSANF